MKLVVDLIFGLSETLWMAINYVASLVILPIRYISRSVASSEVGSHIRVEHNGATVNIINTEDFLSNMTKTFLDTSVQSKVDVYTYLNRMLDRPKSDVVAYCKGMQLITQTRLLSSQEKTEWLERNAKNTMPPFLVYQGILIFKEGRYQEGMEQSLAGLFWTRDELKYCTDDPSCQAGFSLLMTWYQMERGALPTNVEFDNDEIAIKANEILQTIEIDENPLWIKNHGMNALMRRMNPS